MSHPLNGIWEGETAFIIGGGPSLKGFDFTPIKHRNVIGVNNSYRFGSWVDVCWFGDLKWWNWHKKELKTFKGIVAHCNTRSDIINCKWLVPYERRGPLGIDTTPNCVSWNRCSGFSAINLAYHMGAKTIFLLGFDMNHDGSQRNWHNDHQETVTLKDAEGRYKHYLTACKHIQKAAKRLNLRIINGNPNSAIVEFPKMTWGQFLKEEGCKDQR